MLPLNEAWLAKGAIVRVQGFQTEAAYAATRLVAGRETVAGPISVATRTLSSTSGTSPGMSSL